MADVWVPKGFGDALLQEALPTSKAEAIENDTILGVAAINVEDVVVGCFEAATVVEELTTWPLEDVPRKVIGGATIISTSSSPLGATEEPLSTEYLGYDEGALEITKGPSIDIPMQGLFATAFFGCSPQGAPLFLIVDWK